MHATSGESIYEEANMYGDDDQGQGYTPTETPVETPAVPDVAEAPVTETPAIPDGDGEPGTFAPSADGTPATEAHASNIPAPAGDTPVS